MRYCEKENLRLIVGCNSNAHNTACGSTNCNVSEESLLEFLSSSNLEILNRGNEPTFCNVSRQEEIDITLGPMDSRKHHPLGGVPGALLIGP